MDVTKVTVLTSEQCGEISVTVNKLKDFWLDRKWGYTLGAATYQDPPLLYPALSSYTNVVLRECCGSTLLSCTLVYQKHWLR